jgi:2-polyprenyl-3-methyl-5-hydroxy-6-metoxy-1,4-benzoquinol methylase
MTEKLNQVKKYFDDTNTYLRDNYYLGIRAQIVREMLGDLEGSRILDLGCGDGSISIQFLSKTNQLTLVDISKPMLERATKNIPEKYKSNAILVNSNFLQFSDPLQYDVAICLGVLAHVDAVDEVIAKVASFLRPGGRCIFQLTDSSKLLGKYAHFNIALHGLFSKKRANGYSLNRTRLNEIVSAAARNGLTRLSTRRHSLMFPFMVRLPKEILYKYDLRVLKNRFLSWCGTEAIVLFRKEV